MEMVFDNVYLFCKICEYIDPKTLQSLTLANKQFANWRQCVSKTLICNGEEKDMDNLLTSSFVKTFPNLKTLEIYNVEWKMYFSENIRYLETLSTMPSDFMDVLICHMFPMNENQKKIKSYVAYHSIFFDNTDCEFTQSDVNPTYYHIESDRFQLTEQTYIERSIDDRYIEISLGSMHTCYDIVIELKKPVRNLKCAFNLGGRNVKEELEYTQMNSTTYKITNFTKDNQLMMISCFWGRTLRITYDDLTLETALPVKLSGMRCHNQQILRGKLSEVMISFNPETEETFMAHGVPYF